VTGPGGGPTLIQAMGESLVDSPDVPSTNLPIHVNIELLVEAAGSGRAAARVLGVAESTLRGWRKGAQPRRENRTIVAAARGTMAGPRWAEIYSGQATIVIHGVVVVSTDVRPRTVYPGRYIPRQTMQGILRAWASADDARAERLLYNAIDTHYQPLQFDVITAVWFE
jgi:hypothetical protein